MPALHIYNANVNIIFETTKKSRILIDAAFFINKCPYGQKSFKYLQNLTNYLIIYLSDL